MRAGEGASEPRPPSDAHFLHTARGRAVAVLWPPLAGLELLGSAEDGEVAYKRTVGNVVVIKLRASVAPPSLPGVVDGSSSSTTAPGESLEERWRQAQGARVAEEARQAAERAAKGSAWAAALGGWQAQRARQEAERAAAEEARRAELVRARMAVEQEQRKLVERARERAEATAAGGGGRGGSGRGGVVRQRAQMAAGSRQMIHPDVSQYRPGSQSDSKVTFQNPRPF